jgi:stage III sporulation protein AD
MNVFLKASAGAIITIVLYLTISKQNKDISVLVAIAGCCGILLAAISYLSPIIEFINRLQLKGGLDENLLRTVLKAVGIGIISEITSLICSDSGNAALGKALQFLSVALILWLSLPVFTQLLDLIEEILGTI